MTERSLEEEIIENLDIIDRDGLLTYPDSPFPTAADSAMDRIVELFRGASADERKTIADGLASYGEILVAFVQRQLAIESGRKPRADAPLVKAAWSLIIAEVALSNERWLSLAGLIGTLLEQRGISPSAFFTKEGLAQASVTGRTYRVLAESAWRQPLHALGFVHVTTADGPRFRRSWDRQDTTGWQSRLRQIVATMELMPPGYGLWHIPCAVDEMLVQVGEIAAAVSPFERPAVLKAVAGHRGYLRAFATRRATLAIRQSSVAAIDEAISALTVEDAGDDERETLMDLSVVLDAAQRVGTPAKEAFERAAIWGSPRVVRLFRGFLSRNSEMQSITLMGYSLVKTRDGLRYWHDWTASGRETVIGCPYEKHHPNHKT